MTPGYNWHLTNFSVRHHATLRRPSNRRCGSTMNTGLTSRHSEAERRNLFAKSNGRELHQDDFSSLHLGRGQAATGQLATALGVSPGTVTSMLKTLSESGLVTYTPYEGVRLTPAGNGAGAARRPPSPLDRAVSGQDARSELGRSARRSRAHGTRGQRSADRQDRRVPGPSTGRSARRSDSPLRRLVRNAASRPLAECAVGEEFRLARVIDQSPEFLRFLSGSGLPLASRARSWPIGPKRESSPSTSMATKPRSAAPPPKRFWSRRAENKIEQTLPSRLFCHAPTKKPLASLEASGFGFT